MTSLEPAFPHLHNSCQRQGETEHFIGVTLRDWFATHAPTPTDQELNRQCRLDRARNPHNEPCKPKIRETVEIMADLAYEYADAMLRARQQNIDL